MNEGSSRGNKTDGEPNRGGPMRNDEMRFRLTRTVGEAVRERRQELREIRGNHGYDEKPIWGILLAFLTGIAFWTVLILWVLG